MHNPEKIRNIAIIAHIDHGKTTMLDSLLRQSQIFQSHEIPPERAMDSYDQEKERGITIFSKHTSIYFNDYKINIIDTPGHADFSGEVERVLGMINSVILLVDAKEGPMPQTRFVLKKSLEMGLCPIVVLNKIDRPHANPERALNLTFDLFVELGATDKQLDFPYCYASGLDGFAYLDENHPKKDMKELFELIVDKVPAPTGDLDAPFLMQVATIDYDDYLGRQACGRILEGTIKKNDLIQCINHQGQKVNFRAQKIEGYSGLKKVEMESAGVGDIVAIAGMETVTIGDLFCNEKNTKTPSPISIEEPTLSIDIMVNSSPFAGRDGKNLTMNKIKDRLLHEKKSNVTLKIDLPEKEIDKITVSGRGELHLAILLEAMRREGYEITVSKPQVILKQIDGQTCEPIELAHIEVPEEFSGSVIKEVSKRKGELQSLHTNEHLISIMDFLIPTRGLMGLNSVLLSMSRGLAILTSIFEKFAPHKGPIPARLEGSLISMNAGDANPYACFNLQKRGALFIAPGSGVYEGMIVGENNKENDLIVNITKGKQLNNIRSAGKDENIILTPPIRFTLEEAINYIKDDEYVEITPKHIRLRKKYLNEIDRKRFARLSE
ncbi:MAG TPA: translational GTPase TypA [Chlamydiales bacterium]|nr:translational GTPase TypA [Chlamydiales bacterium]